MRDPRDNAVVVCSIENIDPMGVHTGDSVTVAPQMTLPDEAYQELRDAAIAVIRAVGVDCGGSNIQFARERETGELRVIEMNPRVSRSSALASKATGYPIAKVAAKLAVGYTLDEIPNDLTGTTPASFEPTLDYVVVKFPRFAFEKFPGADTTLGTQMKSVGEAMGIGRTFGEAFLKARRSRELDGPDAWDAARGRASVVPRRAGAARARGRAPRRPRRRRLGAAQAAGPLGRGDRGRLRSDRGAGPGEASRLGRPPRVPARRLLRGRGRGGLELLLLDLGRGGRGPAGRLEAARRDPRLGPEPDRPGDRVRLLLRPRRAGVPRARLRGRDGQLQPGDGLDRLRHVGPPLLRAARRRGGARDLRPRAPGRRRHPVRGSDPAKTCARNRSRRLADPRDAVRRGRPRRGSRAVRGALRRARHRRPAVGDGRGRRRGGLRRRADRLPGARPALVRARRAEHAASATTPSRSRRRPSSAAACSSTASSRARSRSTSTPSATGARRSSPRSWSTSRRPASTRATRPACCRRRRSTTRRSPGSRRRCELLAPALGVVGLVNVQLAVQDGEVFVLEANPRASRTVPFASKAIGVNLVEAACRLAAGHAPVRARPAPRARPRHRSVSRRPCFRSRASPAPIPCSAPRCARPAR